MSSSAKHHKSASKAHKSPKTDRHSSRTDRHENDSVNFLFVVNEIRFTTENHPELDHWGNMIPPARADDYVGERVGTVFRYRNGTVTQAEEYRWIRSAWRTEGYIYYAPHGDEYGNNTFPLGTYSSSTVLDLGPFFPCAYALADATICDLSMNEAPLDMFYALQFNNQDGVSRAFFNGGSKFIAGRANWLERLVPAAYRNPPDAEVRSPTNLGGHLGAVLGLMALAERPGQTDHAFSHHWNGTVWRGTRQETVSPHGPPRGVLVYVAVDPRQDFYQGVDAIRDFENNGYAVLG
ncbi:hypothetical protein F4775DRAFT_133854 [Biscogniauxia sp. FL1348]|nr:hypothetical protein F4775DRAFT_133854 [Biscogniauxia sp. FL1348]